MTFATIKNVACSATGGVLLCAGLAAAPAMAVPVITAVNADLANDPFTFSYRGSSFTVTGSGGFPNYLAVSTAGGGAVRTVFGAPSTDFTDRGTVVYDANTLGGYASFASLTSIPFTNGNNFLGLRVTDGGQDYYGFLFTTDARLNSYGFETTANTGITATESVASVIPEPATWGMMIIGFGLVGASMRRRRQSSISVS
jgi:hypothetical protein